MFVRLRSLCIVFFLFARFLRARLFYSRKFTFSPYAECFRHIGGACKKCDFCARFRLLIHFVHENLGELSPAIFRETEGDTAARLSAISVFSLCVRPFRAHTLLRARIHPLPVSLTAIWVRRRKSAVLLAQFFN